MARWPPLLFAAMWIVTATAASSPDPLLIAVAAANVLLAVAG